jgi:hypothetical protein
MRPFFALVKMPEVRLHLLKAPLHSDHRHLPPSLPSFCSSFLVVFVGTLQFGVNATHTMTPKQKDNCTCKRFLELWYKVLQFQNFQSFKYVWCCDCLVVGALCYIIRASNGS